MRIRSETTAHPLMPGENPVQWRVRLHIEAKPGGDERLIGFVFGDTPHEALRHAARFVDGFNARMMMEEFDARTKETAEHKRADHAGRTARTDESD